MILSLAGSAGMGIVWGWLIGNLYGCTYHPQRTIPVVSLATFTVFMEVYILEDTPAVMVLGGAIVLACIISIFWRRQLCRDAGLLDKNFTGG